DLMLSGHTHGGQIFPFHLFVRLQQPVVRGLRKLLGVWVYAHRGTGFWGPPMRLFSTPGIAEITLTPATWPPAHDRCRARRRRAGSVLHVHSSPRLGGS